MQISFNDTIRLSREKVADQTDDAINQLTIDYFGTLNGLKLTVNQFAIGYQLSVKLLL